MKEPELEEPESEDLEYKDFIKQIENQNKILKELAEKFQNENNEKTPPSACKTSELNYCKHKY